jgi:hypothetical protein
MKSTQTNLVDAYCIAHRKYYIFFACLWLCEEIYPILLKLGILVLVYQQSGRASFLKSSK